MLQLWTFTSITVLSPGKSLPDNYTDQVHRNTPSENNVQHKLNNTWSDNILWRNNDAVGFRARGFGVYWA